MISTLLLDTEGNTSVTPVDVIRAIVAEHPDGNHPPIWVDLEDPTDKEESEILEEVFRFHPLAVRDCRRERINPDGEDHLPKVEDYGRYLFSIVNPLDAKEFEVGGLGGQIRTRQLNAFLGESFIVTHHYEPLAAIDYAREACRKNPLFLRRGPDYINHLILDAVVDGYSPILDMFDGFIEDVESEIFLHREARTLQRILHLKRQIFVFRRLTIHQREMVQRLARGEFDLVNESEIAYYRNVYDHLVRAADLAESYRDMLTSMLDAYLSTTSNRLNEIMKVLAVISTFFLPLTFIAGVYGMNFHFMPELGWRYGYGLALGLMGATALAMWIYFRRRGWL